MISNAAKPTFDIHVNSLLAAICSHPWELLSNQILSIAEKRCVLTTWALRRICRAGQPLAPAVAGFARCVPLSKIIAALRDLDDDDLPPFEGALRVPVVEEPAMAVCF